MSNLGKIQNGLFMLALFVFLSMKRKAFEPKKSLVLPVILVLSAWRDGQVGLTGLPVLMAVGVGVLGFIMGLIRGFTMRIQREDGQWMVEGTWITAVLLLVSVALHLLLVHAMGPRTTGSIIFQSFSFYLGSLLIGRNLVLWFRISSYNNP